MFVIFIIRWRFDLNLKFIEIIVLISWISKFLVSIPYIFPFSMLCDFKCTGENFSLRKAVLEIKEDLKSEAIWYIFGPFTKYGKYGPKGSFKAFYRTHFFIWICGNCRNSLSHFFRKNFVKLMVLVIKLLNSWFDEIYFQWTRNSLPSKLFSRQINL